MLGTALLIANRAKKAQEKIEEERKAQLKNLTKTRKQGWHKKKPSARASAAGTLTPKSRRGACAQQPKSNVESIPRAVISSLPRVPPLATLDTPREVIVVAQRNFLLTADDGISILTGDRDPCGIIFNQHQPEASYCTASLALSPRRQPLSPTPVSPCNSTSTKCSLASALIHAMDNDQMADVTLLGKDGAKIRASKYVMACRSSALKETMYGDQTKVEVYIGDYTASVIEALKDFCYTGSISRSSLFAYTTADDQTVRELVALASLSKRYGVEALYDKVDSILRRIIYTNPSLATAVYDATGQLGLKSTLEEYSLQRIKKYRPDLLLNTDAMRHLSEEQLVSLFDQMNYTSEVNILRYLIIWIGFKGGDASSEQATFVQELAHERLSLESLLLRPEAIPLVRSSGLFDLQDVDSILIDTTHASDEDREMTGAIELEAESTASSANTSPSSKRDNKHKKKKKPKTSKNHLEGVFYQLTAAGGVVALSVAERSLLVQ